MKKKMVYLATCGVGVILLGCASEQRRFTGFLRDYSVLKPHPTIQDALVYWNPDCDPRQYEAVLVEPVEIHFMRPSEESRAKAEDVTALREYVTEELTAAISNHAPIATEPGLNVLRCRLQVANVQLTREAGDPQYPWLPPDYALASANIETEARDSISGELVVAYVGPRGGVEIRSSPLLAGPPDLWEPARAGIRHRIVTWTDHAARLFVSQRGKADYRWVGSQTAAGGAASPDHSGGLAGPGTISRTQPLVGRYSRGRSIWE